MIGVISDYKQQRPTTARSITCQLGTWTWVRIAIRNARPDTLYTAWLRVKGNDPEGNSFGGNPLTNGGATPLAPGTALDSLEQMSPWNSAGSSSLVNGFMTNVRVMAVGYSYKLM